MTSPETEITPLLTSREVAQLLHVSTATLSRWRDRREGPSWVDLRGIPRYRIQDIRTWTDQRTQQCP